MGHTDFASMPCPIARSMAVLGERWAILLMREAFYGSTRFDDFQRHLGIAPNILSARLKTLVEHGMFERVPADGGTRHHYRLTEKGRDFFPAFVALKAWADRWMTDRGPMTLLLDRRTGDEIAAPALTRADGSPVALEDLQVVAGPAAGHHLRRRFSAAAADADIAPPIQATEAGDDRTA